MAALTVWTCGDGLLSVLAPIGLAMIAGTALVIDLDPQGPSFGGKSSLAALVESSPRRDDLQPSAPGPAFLANGGVEPETAEPVVRALMKGWPAVVLRSPDDLSAFTPVVPIYPMLPGPLASVPDRYCVFQRTGFRVEQPADGIVLPRPRSNTIQRILGGSTPVRSRWVQRWRQVWEHPWR